MRYQRRPLRRTILPLVLALALPLLGGCSEKLLGPRFPFAGEWSGSIADPTILSADNHSLKISMDTRIGEDGEGRVDRERVLNFGSYTVTIRLIMQIEVLPDGSVTGTGTYSYGPPVNMQRQGEIVGQMDMDATIGTGALILEAETNAEPISMGWTLRRSR